MKTEIKLYNFLLTLTLLCMPAYILLMLDLLQINAYYSAVLGGMIISVIILANIINKEIKDIKRSIK